MADSFHILSVVFLVYRTIFASFHSSGNTPASSHLLNSKVNDGAICSDVSIKSLALIPSGPDALLTLSERSADATSKDVREISEKTLTANGWKLRRRLDRVTRNIVTRASHGYEVVGYVIKDLGYSYIIL